MKVAITGSDGFLGQALIKKLTSQKITYQFFDFKKHNLLKPKTLKNFLKDSDVIIHLAAVNRGEDLDILKVNTLGTLSLLKAASEYSPNAKIIFSSTFQVYLNWSLYGFSKKFAEAVIQQFIKKSNLKAVILRISNIYGPGGKPFYNSVIATFTHLIKNNQPIKINGDGTTKRDFVYVDDVAQAIIKACLYPSKKSFEIIDICSGKETTLNQILKIIKNVSRKKFEVVYNKAAKEKPWPTSNKNYQKAKQLLRWRPTTSLNEGLKKVINHG